MVSLLHVGRADEEAKFLQPFWGDCVPERRSIRADQAGGQRTALGHFRSDHAANWALHYRLRYQSFTDAVNGNNLSSPLRSINVEEHATASELLTAFTWKDYRMLHTPVSEFSYTGKLVPRLEARGGYIFYRYSGPSSLDMAFRGTARRADGSLQRLSQHQG